MELRIATTRRLTLFLLILKCLVFRLLLVISFCVRREANNLVHVLAKFASVHIHALCCNKTSLPPIVNEAWLRDSLLC
jgi:hypothetical protein